MGSFGYQEDWAPVMPKVLHISSFIGLSVIQEIGRTCIKAKMIFYLTWVFKQFLRVAIDGNCLSWRCSYQGKNSWLIIWCRVRKDAQGNWLLVCLCGSHHMFVFCFFPRQKPKSNYHKISAKNTKRKKNFFVGNADVKQLQGLSPARSLPIHSQPGPH